MDNPSSVNTFGSTYALLGSDNNAQKKAVKVSCCGFEVSIPSCLTACLGLRTKTEDHQFTALPTNDTNPIVRKIEERAAERVGGN